MPQMSQSMLAVLALVLLGSTGLAVPVARDYLHTRAVAAEVAEMGAAVAARVVRVIRTRPFDQAVSEGRTSRRVSDRALFTFERPEDHFPGGKACRLFGTGEDDCDDVDDFHRMQTATLPFVLGLDTVFFRVDVDVTYVDEKGRRASEATFRKKITVRVRDVRSSTRARPYLSRPITYARVVSYEF